MLKSLFKRRKHSRAGDVYAGLVARARHADFYSNNIVPDTFDGRFEMMVMHLYLLHSRLKETSENGRRFSQELFDAFISDMDAGLREAGVGDQTVPKRINKMTRVFYGRTGAYDDIFDSETDIQMQVVETIGRNLFPDASDAAKPAKGQATILADYMIYEHGLLSGMSEHEITDQAALFEGAPKLNNIGAN